MPRMIDQHVSYNNNYNNMMSNSEGSSTATPIASFNIGFQASFWIHVHLAYGIGWYIKMAALNERKQLVRRLEAKGMSYKDLSKHVMVLSCGSSLDSDKALSRC
nr:hypothetical protein [Tanacetum cinerariifolium]